MNILRKYGHKHFGLFYKRFLEVTDSGFKYRGKNYIWADIKSISRFESYLVTFFFYQWGYPLAIIYLSNKKKIYLYGRILQEEGKESEVNFWVPTKSYNNLVSLIESKINV